MKKSGNSGFKELAAFFLHNGMNTAGMFLNPSGSDGVVMLLCWLDDRWSVGGRWLDGGWTVYYLLASAILGLLLIVVSLAANLLIVKLAKSLAMTTWLSVVPAIFKSDASFTEVNKLTVFA
jgi:hypothetical protein